jgi:hypothetical protein
MNRSPFQARSFIVWNAVAAWPDSDVETSVFLQYATIANCCHTGRFLAHQSTRCVAWAKPGCRATIAASCLDWRRFGGVIAVCSMSSSFTWSVCAAAGWRRAGDRRPTGCKRADRSGP